MNKTVARCALIVIVGAWLTISVCAPWVLSDNNVFLKDFVKHEFLNLLGVIVAITLASAANLHLEFNKIEDLIGRSFLLRTRSSVKRSAAWLIGLFALGFLLVLGKPLFKVGEIGGALINGFAVVIVAVNILVLVDLTQLVFKIEPMFKIKPEDMTSNDS